jgi:hypothetical protein
MGDEVLVVDSGVPRLGHYVTRTVAGNFVDIVKRSVPRTLLNKATDLFKD